MKSDCYILVRDFAMYTLCCLPLIGIFGVGIHALLSNWLVCFDFKKDGSKKGTAQRLFLPLIAVGILGGIMPFIITECFLIDCILDVDIEFLNPYQRCILPVSTNTVPFIICSGLSIIFYFILGFMTYGIWKIAQVGRE